MFALLTGWFGKKVAGKAIPWKAIGVAVVVIGVAIGVYTGYRYVMNLQTLLANTAEELGQQKARADVAEATRTRLNELHEKAIADIEKLEVDRQAAIQAATDAADLIRDLNLEEEFSRDANKAVDALRARNGQLNRMLEGQSRR